MSKKIITIIISTYNGAQTIDKLFESLEKQNNKELIKEIIVVDGKSSDKTIEIIKMWKNKSSYSIRLIPFGSFGYLSSKYNVGIKNCQTPYFVLMHQDSFVLDKNAFKKALNPLSKADVVGSYPLVCWPRPIWEKYSFWRKYMLPVGRYMPVCAGKFDCFNRKLFLEKLGLYNERIDTAEDMDLIFRTQRKNLKLVLSNIKIIHNHRVEKKFTLWQSLKVLFRVNEIQGYYFRQYGILNLTHFLITFFRPILLMGLLFPYIRYLSIILILIYSFIYSGSMYFAKKKDVRLLLLPLVNLFALFLSSYYSLKGIIINNAFHETT